MLSFVTPFILTPGESKRSEYNPRKQQLRVNLLLVSLRAADSTKLCQRSDDINVTNVARDMRIGYRVRPERPVAQEGKMWKGERKELVKLIRCEEVPKPLK